MSAQQIITSMKTLVEIHQTFNELALEKTECLTKGDISHLRAIMQKEAAQIKQLQTVEAERVRLVRHFINSRSIDTKAGTITELLPYLTEQEKQELIGVQKRLLNELTKLKQQNELNQQLINDSLRFVNLSLDMITPDKDTGNYSRTKKEEDEPLQARSLFDSKA